MTKKTIIKMEERINFDLLKRQIKKLNLNVEFEASLAGKLEDIRKKVKNGVIRVKYDYPRVIKDREYGRLHPEGKENYCTMESSIRSFFAREYYQYIDLSCCHAYILRDLSAHYEVDGKSINDYCNDRNFYLEKYNVSKKYINNQCNDERKYVNCPEFVSSIYEMIYSKNGLCSRLVGEEYFVPLWNELKKTETENVRGKFMALVCQTFESRIVKRAIQYFEERGISPNSYIFDGLFLKKEINIDLKILNEYLQYEYIGIKLKPIFKIEEFEISDQYLKIFNRADQEEDDLSTLSVADSDIGDLTDSEIALEIINANKSKIINNKGTLYAYSRNSWTKDIKAVFDEYISVCDLNIVGDPKKKPKLVKNNTSHWKYYNTQMYNWCQINLKPVDILNREIGKVPFLNGIYDLATKKFEPYGNNTMCYSTMCVQRDFPTDTSKKEQLKKILLEICGDSEDILKEFMSFVARAVGQHVSDKLALDVIGDRNSGKGVLCQLIEDSFVGIVGNFILDSLHTNTGKYETAERRNGSLEPFCSNRLCLGSEAKQGTAGIIDGALWRKAVSGGDEISYRVAYGKLEVDRIKATLISFKNTVSLFDQANSSDTLLVFNCPCKFQDTVPTDGIERGYIIKKADRSIKNMLGNPSIVSAFTLLVFDYYQEDVPSYEKFAEESNEIAEIDEVDNQEFKTLENIKKLFIICPLDSTKRLKIAEVHARLQRLDPNHRPAKTRKIMESLGIIIKKNQNREYVGIAYRTD